MAVKTVNEVIAEGLDLELLSEDDMTRVRELVKTVSIEKKLTLAYQLKDANLSGTKIKPIFEKFLFENTPHPPSLRSGSIRRLAHGEHRILGVGEEFPFELTLEQARYGGVSVVRKILRNNEYLALKTLQTNVKEDEFMKELKILKDVDYMHVCSAVASLKDQTERFHILLKPWCDVQLPRSKIRLTV